MIKVLTVCPIMNDDDVDFKPSQSTSSNLTSLFDANKPQSSGNVSLTYTAPKAPKEGEGPSQQRQSTSKSVSNGKLKIITSTTVQNVYKLENEKYVNQGTAGVAIVGNYDLHMYQIILYKNNKDHICKILISINFLFTILENNYASFYDSTGQNWLILFSSLANAQLFAKQVAIAKFNSQKKPENIIIQDLLHVGGNKNKAKKEDVIRLKCNSFMLNKEEIVPLKEKSSMFIELVDGVSFPWHEGLKNCSEQCQRVIIMPHKLSAPWTEEIPPTAALLLEIEIESITPTASTSAELEKKNLHKGGYAANIKEEIQADSSVDEDHGKEKSCSLQERVLLSKVEKMDLITRIARMGHALPLKEAFVSEPCGLDEETYSATKSPKKLRTGNNAIQFNQFVPADPCSCQAKENDSSQKDPKNHQMVTMTFQRSGVNIEGQQMFPFVTAPCTSKEDKTVQASGSKNIELGLRMSIDKISEKVDHVLSKLEHLDFSTKGKAKELPGPTPDTLGVITTIQGVISENEILKNDVKIMKSKIDEQNRKIQSLVDLTQSCVDKCSSTEKRQDDAQGRVSDFEEDAKSPDHHVVQATSRINQLLSYIDHYRKELSENHNKMKETNAKVRELTEKLKTKEEELQNMEEELNRIKKENKSVVTLNESRSFSNRSEDFGEGAETSKEPASDDYLYDEIKKVMNAINRKLQSSFENDKTYSGVDVKDKIARMIKGVFMAYMKYKGKARSTSREDARVVAERRIGSREISHQSYSAEEPDSDRHKGSDDAPRIPISRIKFADDQEYEMNRGEENFEDVKLREVYKRSISDRSRSDSGPRGQSVLSHVSQRDSRVTSEMSPFPGVMSSGMVGSGVEETVSGAEKSGSQLMKESKSRSRSERPSAEHENQHEESADEFSKQSEILDEGTIRSIRDSSPRLSFEHEVEYGESLGEISKKSAVLNEAIRSGNSSQSPRLTFEHDAQHPESADELFKKSEILDEEKTEVVDEAARSIRDLQSQRPTFEHEVEYRESVEQVDEHSKKSGILDEGATRSVTGSISHSLSRGRSDTSVESKTDNSTSRHSATTDGSVLPDALSEIEDSDNLRATSRHSREKSSYVIESKEQNTSQTNSQMSVLHSRDQFLTSRKSTNENSMNITPSDAHQITENVTSGTTLNKTPLEVTSTTFQEPVLKSILKNRETSGSTIAREENDIIRSRTSSRREDETADGKSEASTNRSSRAPSGTDGEFDKISDSYSSLTNIQKQDLKSRETEKSIENLSSEPSSDFNNSKVRSQGSEMDRKSVEEKLSSKASVKQEREKEREEEREEEREGEKEEKEESEKSRSASEAPSDSTKTSRVSSIKSETLEGDTGTKEDNEDNGSRVNDEEEKVESSESESSDSSRNSTPEKSGTDDVSDERSESGPGDASEREDADQPGQMFTSGLSDLNNSNGTVKNFGTKRNSKERDEDRRDSRGSMGGNTDGDSLTRKISYIIKEGEIEPTSGSEGFMKNYFRSLTEMSLEEDAPAYYVTEDEKRMELREEERANEGSMKEEDVEGEEGEKYSDNYKEGLISKKNVTFSSNPVTDSSYITDYYKNWGTSIPPPLPLDGDDSSSQDDEEWL